MTVIDPDRQEADTVSGPRQMVEILAGVDGLDWQPHFSPKARTLGEMAKQTIYRREVWCLEFSFKPLRMLHVEVPQPDGRIDRELVWYLVYQVRNTGFHLNPSPKPDRWGHPLYETTQVNHSVRFFPRFVLESFDQHQQYVDRVIPLAVKAIQAIEDPNVRLYNSVEISDINIAVDQSVWGVATWQDVDPQTDFFAVFVQQLTNAYRWDDPAGAFQKGDAPGTGRVYQYKTLQLNFWRPGDAVRQHQDEIRFGLPSLEDVQGRTLTDLADLLKLYRIPDPRDYLWVYRPGGVVRP
jgi:hypothetical protein